MVALWYLDFNNHVCRVLKHRDRYVEIKLELRGEGVHFEEDGKLVGGQRKCIIENGRRKLHLLDTELRSNLNPKFNSGHSFSLPSLTNTEVW